ncbi:MAG: apolipoprotein N-acyltransferase [Candidatus Omnitrophota bacterium]|nr:apolipoprotein N-acyltransferase [Candidatus Omnitrophota bacterium]
MGEVADSAEVVVKPRPSPHVSRPLLLALGSAALLVFSFPNFNQPWCAWVALVPWLLLLRNCPARAAFWWSYFIGALFFVASMWWLIHVTLVGWIILCAYLALYFALFGLLVRYFHFPLSTFHLLVIPAAWVSLEVLRSHLLSGLGWNLLAYSQTPWLALIQFADSTGAWGISFLIVLVNVAIARFFEHGTPTSDALRGGAVAMACVLVAVGYGTWRLPQPAGAQTARVAIVQGNIPQEEKWDEARRVDILTRYAALSEAAAATEPSLIVWPETSVPGYLGIDETLTQQVIALARRVERPLLVGAPIPTIADARVTLRNSAILVDPEGMLSQRYDKLHLVPFGEFVPFERNLPWLRNLLPPIGDFSPGREYTVFTIAVRNAEFGMRNSNSELPTPNSELRFSTLICFEDIFPELARRFVQRGAQFLLVITNDAWFGPTAAAYQHAQASTFRAVELRVPVARAANTGWSGCIDAAGRWISSVRDPGGRELFIEGTTTCDLPLGTGGSLYRRWGDWFAGLCLILTLTWLGLHLVFRERPSKSV